MATDLAIPIVIGIGIVKALVLIVVTVLAFACFVLFCIDSSAGVRPGAGPGQVVVRNDPCCHVLLCSVIYCVACSVLFDHALSFTVLFSYVLPCPALCCPAWRAMACQGMW